MDFNAELTKVYPRLNMYARSLRSNPEHAKDLLHDTIVRIMDKQHKFSNDGKPQAFRRWCFTVMHNIHVNHIRADTREYSVVKAWPADFSGELFIDPPDAIPEPAIALNIIHAKEVAAYINNMPEEKQDVLREVAADGMRYEDAAMKLDIPVGTVRSRLSRSRAELREYFV